MQQTTLAMWKHFDQFEIGTNFSAWACCIAKNRALNFFQTRDRRRLFTTEMIELLAKTEAERPPEERLARRRALQYCLEKLSAKDRSLMASMLLGRGDHQVRRRIDGAARSGSLQLAQPDSSDAF